MDEDDVEISEDKWLAETVFHCKNTGDAVMEFFIVLHFNKDIQGKHFAVNPGKSKRVTIQEMLPEQFQDWRKLDSVSASMQIHNLSEDKEGTFQTTMEGPFKQPYSNMEIALIDEAQKLLEVHQNAMLRGTASEKRALLKVEIPLSYYFKKDAYTSFCHARGRLFSSLMMTDEADANFETGWEDYQYKMKWFYCIDWANALMLSIQMPLNINEKTAKLNKAITLLEEFKVWSKLSIYEKYNNIAADGMMAFCYCYQGKPEEARKILSAIDYTPIVITDMNSPELNSFYDYYGYAIAAAIELRDVELIKGICDLISFGKEYNPGDTVGWRRLKMTLGYMRQNNKPQLKNLFDIFKEHSANYYPELANLTAFLKLMKRNDEAGMEKHFR